MAGDINRVTIVGRLTRDPELAHLPSGTAVLKLAVAVNNHLAKGRRVGVDGRLDWSSWEAQDGSKRSKVEIVAQSVQFLDSRGEGGGGDGERQFVPAAATAGNEDFSSSAADDDI